MMHTFTVVTFLFLLLLASSICLVPQHVSKSNLLLPNPMVSRDPRRLTRRSTGSMSILFNNDETTLEQPQREFRVKTQPRCNDLEGNQGYCTEDPDYDETVKRRFEAILKSSPISNIITDVLNETVVPPSQPGPSLRVGFTSEQTPCPSSETIIYPKRGQTPNNDWVFILQGSVQQGVKMEKCLRTGSQCQFGGGGLPQTACRQKYIYKKLLTMDTSGNNIISESLYLPSCCVCYVSSDFVSTRISNQK